MKLTKGGIYQHKNGSLYEIIAFAIHTERDEQLVVFQSIGGRDEGTTYAHPFDDFVKSSDFTLVYKPGD